MTLRTKDMQSLEVLYRWQITKWDKLDLIPYPVWPAIVVDDVLLEQTCDIHDFLKRYGISFEEFIARVPHGFVGTTAILA